MFGLVEEFILPFVVDHARPSFPATTIASGRCFSSPAKRPSIFICSSAFARNSRRASAASANLSGRPKT